jgi:imidazolonepropionase-like amidohydrolase
MLRHLAVSLAALLSSCTTPSSDPGAPALLLDGVTLIDGRGGPPVPDRFLLIRNGKIAAIGRSGTAKVGKGMTRLDLSGRYVIPGLIDSHVHLKSRPRDPGMMEMILKSVLLRSGVTTVRDMGGNGAELAPLARATQGSNASMPESFCRAS